MKSANSGLQQYLSELNTKKRLSLGIGLSLLCHVLVLGVASLSFVDNAEFGVSSGHGGTVEIDLLAPAQDPKQAPSLANDVMPQVAPQPATEVSGTDRITAQSNGCDVTTPGYLDNPAPAYPERARSRGQEGTVLVRASVDNTGAPTKVELQKTSGYQLLDDAAIRAVRQWRFKPAHVGPIAIESRVHIPVTFRLDED